MTWDPERERQRLKTMSDEELVAWFQKVLGHLIARLEPTEAS